MHGFWQFLYLYIMLLQGSSTENGKNCYYLLIEEKLGVGGILHGTQLSRDVRIHIRGVGIGEQGEGVEGIAVV